MLKQDEQVKNANANPMLFVAVLEVYKYIYFTIRNLSTKTGLFIKSMYFTKRHR